MGLIDGVFAKAIDIAHGAYDAQKQRADALAAELEETRAELDAAYKRIAMLEDGGK